MLEKKERVRCMCACCWFFSFFLKSLPLFYFLRFFVRRLNVDESAKWDPREALAIAIAVNVYDVYSVGVIQVENDYWIFSESIKP